MTRRRKKARCETAAVSRGSAFHALSIENADALMLRSRLMREVGEVIKMSKFSRQEVGEKTGMNRARVSALIMGKISKFSTSELIRVLTLLGQDVEIVVNKSLTRPNGFGAWLVANEGALTQDFDLDV